MVPPKKKSQRLFSVIFENKSGCKFRGARTPRAFRNAPSRSVFRNLHAGTYSHASPFSARARKTAPGAGALPILLQRSDYIFGSGMVPLSWAEVRSRSHNQLHCRLLQGKPVARRRAHLSFLQALISTGLQPGVRGPAPAKPFQRLCFPACGKTVETVSRYHGQHHPAEAGC